jgi:Enoyl-(Acyl carrier protein) reductase
MVETQAPLGRRGQPDDIAPTAVYLASSVSKSMTGETLLVRLGHSLGAVLAAALVSYILVKFIQRQRFLRSLRIARILPEELKRRLDSGDETIAVIDTRSRLDVTAVPYTIPGATWIAAEEIEGRRRELPRDREIVLYCS